VAFTLVYNGRLNYDAGINYFYFYCSFMLQLFLCSRAFSEDSWSFVVTGDVRDKDTTNTGVSSYLPAISDKIVSLGPKAVFLSGDLINGDELPSSPDPNKPRIPYAVQFANFKSYLGMKSVYDAGIDIYPVRGNHESGGHNDKPPIPSLKQAYYDAVGLSVPQNGPNNGPSDNQVGYSWNLKLNNIRVIGVDDYFYFNPAQQGNSNYYKIDQAWLETQLTKTAPKRYTFVMAHEPVYYLEKQSDFYGSTSPEGVADRKEFWDSLGSNGVKMYLCSHVHNVQVGTANDSHGNTIYQNMIGNGGAPLDSPSKSDPNLNMTYQDFTSYGFALFTVTNESMAINYHLYDPKTQKWSIGFTYTANRTQIDGTEDPAYMPYLSITGDGSRFITGSLSMDAGATLSVGEGAQVTCSTLDVKGNSTLVVEAGGTVSYGQITSKGPATISDSNKVILDVKGYIPSESQFTVVDGNGGQGVAGGLTATATSPVFTVTSNPIDSADLIITATRSHPYDQLANNSNSAAVGALLENRGRQGASGDILEILNGLDSCTSKEQINDVLNSMTPAVNNGISQVSYGVISSFLGSINSHLESLRFEKPSKVNDIWAEGFGNYSRQDPRDLSNGYHADVLGTAIGYDRSIMTMSD